LFFPWATWRVDRWIYSKCPASCILPMCTRICMYHRIIMTINSVGLHPPCTSAEVQACCFYHINYSSQQEETLNFHRKWYTFLAYNNPIFSEN
jgi:hypothetical protein